MPALQTLYRPQSFNDIIGNSSTIKSLHQVLGREQAPSAFLLTGPAGAGKTTIARIIIDSLGCSNSDAIELNASSDRGINTIRSLGESLRFAPLSGTKKVIFLDEAHKLTPDAQEALLKNLEEPPAYVHWILCTTNPETLKTTLKRRCHQYTLSKLNPIEIKQLLKKVLLAEGVKISKFRADVIEQLIKIAEGSAGQALKLLDMIIDLTDPIDMITIIKNTDLICDESDIATICKILVDQKITSEDARWKKLAPILRELQIEPESGRRIVLAWMDKVLLSNGSARIAGIMANFSSNFYDSGKSGFDLACYFSCMNMEG